MSTALGALSGKERSAAINFWAFVLILALTVFALNFYFSTVRSSEENAARDLVAEIQVLSQEVAKFSGEAAAGNFDAFEELRVTRARTATILSDLQREQPR